MSEPHRKKLKAADDTQAAMALFKRSLTSGSSQGSSDHPDPDSQYQATSESSSHPNPDSQHQTTSESSSHPNPDSQHQTTPWESSLPPPTTLKPPLHPPTMPSSSIPAPPLGRPLRSVRTKRQIEKDEARKAELREMKKRGVKIQLSSQYDPIKKKMELVGHYIRDPEFDSFETKRLLQENEELKAKIVNLEEKTSNQDAVILDLKQKLDSLNVPYGVPTAPASSTR